MTTSFHPRSRAAAAAVASLLALTSPLFAQQRVVRESAADWRAARPLSLEAQGRWCTEVDAQGCDLKAIDNAILLPDGGIITSDIRGPLYRFGSDGRFAGALSRKGQGPGEYGFIVSPQLVPDGRLVWFDNSQMRITSIALDGKAGPVTRVMPPPTMATINLVGETLVVLDIPAIARKGDTVDATYHTVPPSGSPRVLARVRTPSVFDPGSDMRRLPGPFQPRIVSDVGTGGDVAHSNGAGYIVDVAPAAGAPWRLQVDMPARAVTAADRDSAAAALVRAFRVANVNSLPPAVREDLASVPSTFPALSAVRVLRDGTVWIRPTVAAGERVARWDVFARDGRRIGRASLPLGAGVRDGARDWVLVVEPGDDDVPRVVRYRVRS
jgi:hypothetical protein